QHETLRFAESCRGLPAIENPNRDEVQDIKAGGYARERRPKLVVRAVPEHRTNRRSQKPCQRPSKADGCSRFPSNTQRVPSHKRAETGKKNGHLRGKPAPTNVNVVPHFVEQNQSDEPRGKRHAPVGPVKTEEEKKANRNFSLKSESKRNLLFARRT